MRWGAIPLNHRIAFPSIEGAITWQEPSGHWLWNRTGWDTKGAMAAILYSRFGSPREELNLIKYMAKLHERKSSGQNVHNRKTKS